MIRVYFPKPQTLSEPRNVRLNCCSISGGWYARLVGQVIAIEFEDSEGYWAREGGQYNCINIIRKADTTLLPLNN